MRNVFAACLLGAMVCACSPAEPQGESEPPAVAPLPGCQESVVITVAPDEASEIAISVDTPVIDNVTRQMMVCWSVVNKTKSDIIVDLADFKHLQFKKDECVRRPDGECAEIYLDPLGDGVGGERGVKRARVGAGQTTPSDKFIRTKARQMSAPDEFDYNGCYKYSVYVAKAESKPTDPLWGVEDPRLEYDDDGRGVEGQTISTMDRCEGT